MDKKEEKIEKKNKIRRLDKIIFKSIT